MHREGERRHVSEQSSVEVAVSVLFCSDSLQIWKRCQCLHTPSIHDLRHPNDKRKAFEDAVTYRVMAEDEGRLPGRCLASPPQLIESVVAGKASV